MKTTYKSNITKSRAGHYTVSILELSKHSGHWFAVKKQNLIDNIYSARFIATEMLAEITSK